MCVHTFHSYLHRIFQRARWFVVVQREATGVQRDKPQLPNSTGVKRVNRFVYSDIGLFIVVNKVV